MKYPLVPYVRDPPRPPAVELSTVGPRRRARGLAAAGGVRGCAVRGVSGCSVVSYQYLVIMQNL